MRQLVWGLAIALAGCTGAPSDGDVEATAQTESQDADADGDPHDDADPADDETTGDADGAHDGASAEDSGGNAGEASDADGGTDLPDPDDPDVVTCEPDAVFPDPEWAVGDPVAFGLDPTALELAADYAQAEDSYCLVVIRDGHLVFERYFHGNDAEAPVKSWSVAKSYASALVGIALGRGELGSVDDSIADYLPQFVGTEHEEVTLHHMLSMTTGMYPGLIADMADMFFSEDMTALAVSTPMSGTPGAAWRYSNIAVQLLEPILHVAAGVEAHVYAQQHLFSRIGMQATWMQDPAGNAAMYMNVLASCRDHARFGYLYLQRGCWDGEQVVPHEWVERSTQPSQEHNLGYGYWWWLSGGEPTLDLIDASVLPGGTLHGFGPDDSYCADGLGSQTIEVVPSQDMVIVRMGRSPMEDIDGNPLPLFPILEMLEDGKMVAHNGVVERVLAAVLE